MARNPELPTDIIYEILLNLPVKTLYRFRCVCKPWNSLISSPSFQGDHHRHRSRQIPHLLVIKNDYDNFRGSHNIHLDTLSNDRRTRINSSVHPTWHSQPPSFYVVQSLQGLVCLASRNGSHILICNPSTDEIMVLPTPPTIVIYQYIGFGYAASTQEFKVVRFFYPDVQMMNFCYQIFSLDISAPGWREARRLPYHATLCYGSFLHGAIHLLPNLDPYLDIGDDGHYISAFNMDTEKFRTVPLPACFNGKTNNANLSGMNLSVLGGSLCLTFNYRTREEQMEIWLLKDYNSGDWVKEYNIHVYSVNPLVDNSWPLAIMGDGTILLNVFAGNEYELQLYDPKDRQIFRVNNSRYCTATLVAERFLQLGSSQLSQGG